MIDTILADPPANDLTASDPPAADPPASDPPASDPPASDPPASDPLDDTDWRARLSGGDEKLLGYLARVPSEKALVERLKKHDDDLKAVYHYIRSLAPAGQPAPAFLPPDQTPRPPYDQLPDMSLGR